ncbi:NAD-dependent epimerase/dehydratase family protein [Pedobacter cryophilus]|uniref:NAD-dependent epimerase/dehydratase family protein n=1 Tax=Pedobacter cryophilus TaxID=2571271 RepID=A0A4U1C4Y9_9SPHI|nr:NAD-dependent epimerase/dehydratase family protein [Pedobacter cryophilus]TKC00439.1 NAD-dependent epimerase/dehydratase family protein [Pedobacter cryophilus]
MNITKINKIAVLGCGWLGLPLAKELIEDGYFVKGSTTTISKIAVLAAQHIDPFLVQLNPEIEGDDIQLFLDVDLLIINIPPGRHKGTENNYVTKMANIAKAVTNSPISKIIFISSSSVYPENCTEVAEETAIDEHTPSALSLFQAEEIFRNLKQIKTTVVRMSGLIGPERHPGRFFAGKENIPNGLAPVNLIHLVDCISIIKFIIEEEIWDETINAAAPDHPNKMDFYALASEKYNQSTAQFIAEKQNFKIVSSKKLIDKYGYQFKIPNLMEWLLQTPQS